MWQQYIDDIVRGDFKSLSRCISFVENETQDFELLLQSIPTRDVPIIGITGPPGAGKSTLTDALIEVLIADNKKVAILCVDPSSPFHLGALLGDRIRMRQWHDSPQVFIRSLATRGSLGGLHPKILEISELIKASIFDFIIIETVGVGQSEIEIAGLADRTIVVLVPESGDEIQTMKAGLMEIADIFVVNKADRPGAEEFIKNLKMMLIPVSIGKQNEVPVIATIATQKKGIKDLADKIRQQETTRNADKKSILLTERAFHLIQSKRMKDVDKAELRKSILNEGKDFNMYTFIQKY